MRLLISSLFYRSPFENLQKHADKVRECARLFKEAAVCHVGEECEMFDMLVDKVSQLEHEADDIKRNIRNHLPYGIFMPVDKFQFLHYLREQDKVLDEVEEALFWLSFRPRSIPKEVAADLNKLVQAVIPPIEVLSDLVSLAVRFFKTRSSTLREQMKALIRDIRKYEGDADDLERELKFKIFNVIKDPLAVFHLVHLVEIIGEIADHAQNASDRMRAMIAR
ncbi:MAG: TIGR00153 family protein [Deltaproteobacteria bacterium]|nr:TIGR00153 family protein [Deltaproteobacteria bacterium]MBW1993149.1 TIGR00153 family protein [Deltaproteobacteria bacterium]MBW2151039.1 TIGR00153 family protein [Deltaproteobacteria bacterium]